VLGSAEAERLGAIAGVGSRVAQAARRAALSLPGCGRSCRCGCLGCDPCQPVS
jgi:hypothetical protein